MAKPVLITVFDSETGGTQDYTFSASPVRIGRNPLNDLPLPFPFVSGWHAVVRFDEHGAKFFDLGSTNGTMLGGRRVQPGEGVVIGDGVAVTIGRLELRFRRPTMGPAASEPVRGTPVAAGTIDPDRRPAAPAGEGGTAHVQLADVHHAVARLQPLYASFRHAVEALEVAVEGALAEIPGELHGLALSILGREFPRLGQDGVVARLSRQRGVSLAAGWSAAEDTAVVRGLAENLRPGEEPPASPEEAARFLACVEDVLRAAATTFVELQRGQEQFGHEMGVRTIKEFTPLHAAGTAENVLKYLLDWQTGGPHRTQELIGAYADLMIHQVALINGVMEGVRAVLARLAPQEIERGVTASWPTRAAAVWRRYAERYRELVEDDKRLTATVFGPEFARAYAEVGGEGARRK